MTTVMKTKINNKFEIVTRYLKEDDTIVTHLHNLTDSGYYFGDYTTSLGEALRNHDKKVKHYQEVK